MLRTITGLASVLHLSNKRVAQVCCEPLGTNVDSQVNAAVEPSKTSGGLLVLLSASRLF
jgi:hypothetical protein